MEIIIGLLGFIALFIILLLYNTLSWGFVFFKFYYWFILPIFITLPHITFIGAVGLMVFCAVFRNHNINTLKEEYYKDNKNQRILTSFMAPWLLVGVGYVIKLFIF